MASRSLPLPMALQQFVDSARWTSSRAFPEWPHEYLLRWKADEALFVHTVRHIRKHGYATQFYQLRMTCYEDRGLVYCAMGAPLEAATLIVRCLKEDSFEARLENGTLPGYKDLVW